MSAENTERIVWQDWGDEPFARAAREDKLVLLNISTSWCHWCHVMDRFTYSSPDVIRMINQYLIPVRVDGDRRPDVEERYLLGGWPTTSFLLPDGRLLSGATHMPATTVVNKIRELDTMYRENPSLVTRQVASMAAEAEAERPESAPPDEMLHSEVMESLSRALKNSFDPIHGGFGSDPKFPYPDAVRFAFVSDRKAADSEALRIALRSLDGMMALYDPVWGGFYRYAMAADWSQPSCEKILAVQSAALDNYLEAYSLTGDNRYGEAAAGTQGYVDRFLCDIDRGGFYASQDGDLDRPGKDLIAGAEYYALPESERLRLGIPSVDRTVFADANGMMVSTYLRIYGAMSDSRAREFALKTVERLLREHVRGGTVYHYHDGEPRLPGILADQVYVAQALCDAYQVTGDPAYLRSAEEIVKYVLSELRDVVDGGFYTQLFNPSSIIEPLERHKPFDENVAATRLLVDLYYLTGDRSYYDLAGRTLSAISYPRPPGELLGMGYGVSIDAYVSPSIHVVIVGERTSEEAMAMLEAALHAYAPGKIVQLLSPGGKLPFGEPQWYEESAPSAIICIRNACRPPLHGVEELTAVLNDITGAIPS